MGKTQILIEANLISTDHNFESEKYPQLTIHQKTPKIANPTYFNDMHLRWRVKKRVKIQNWKAITQNDEENTSTRSPFPLQLAVAGEKGR